MTHPLVKSITEHQRHEQLVREVLFVYLTKHPEALPSILHDLGQITEAIIGAKDRDLRFYWQAVEDLIHAIAIKPKRKHLIHMYWRPLKVYMNGNGRSELRGASIGAKEFFKKFIELMKDEKDIETVSWAEDAGQWLQDLVRRNR